LSLSFRLAGLFCPGAALHRAISHPRRTAVLLRRSDESQKDGLPPHSLRQAGDRLGHSPKVLASGQRKSH
jgi:hypothetical protein